MSKYFQGEKSILKYFLLAVLLCSLTITLLLSIKTARSGFNISTDILATLPSGQLNDDIQFAQKKLAAQFQNNVLLSIHSESYDEAINAAQQLSLVLGDTKNFSILNAQQQWSNDFLETLIQYRQNIIDPYSYQEIRQAPLTTLKQRASQYLYGLPIDNPLVAIHQDPFRIFHDQSMQLAANAPPAEFIDSLLILQDDLSADVSVIVLGAMDKAASNIQLQQALLDNIEAAISDIQQQYAGIQIERSGLIFHAAENANQTKSDLSFIATLSSLGILALFLFCFRSISPIALSVIILALGATSGFVVTHYIFGSVHLLTIVFGTTLIGVSIDYAIHYFCAQDGVSNNSKPLRFKVLNKILPSLALSLLTSIIGYTSLSLGNLPLLNQMACYSIVGLVITWLSVCSLFPLLTQVKINIAKSRLLFALASFPKNFWRLNINADNQSHTSASKTPLAITICILILIGSAIFNITHLQPNQNLDIFFKSNPSLISQQIAIQNKMQLFESNRFFLIAADSEEALLQKEEKLAADLNQLIDSENLTKYQATSQLVPSLNKQQENYALLENTFKQYRNELTEHLLGLGYRQQDIHQYFADFESAKSQGLTPQTLGETSSLPLWLGLRQQQYFSLITIQNPQDQQRFFDLAQEHAGVIYADQTQALRDNLSTQFVFAGKLLLLAYLFISVLIALRYRRLAALTIVLAPLLASSCAISLLLLYGVEISLFHIFACYLVLGLGMDYSVFSYDNPMPHNEVAITVSVASSCLSFGLLSAVSSPMLAAFGSMVLIGTLLSWFFAGVISQVRHNK